MAIIDFVSLRPPTTVATGRDYLLRLEMMFRMVLLRMHIIVSNSKDWYKDKNYGVFCDILIGYYVSVQRSNST